MTTTTGHTVAHIENDGRISRDRNAVPNEVGLFSRVANTREIEGLLLPFGELSRPSLSKTEPIMFSAESVGIPRDPSVVTLNDEHDRFNPLGRATSLTVTDKGVVAKFSIADTDEGDAYLASYNDPTNAKAKRKLSAEFGSLVRNGIHAVRSRLTGAAVCTDGAFETAALFSLAPDAEITEELDAEITLDSLTPEARSELERQVREEIAAEIQTTEPPTSEEDTMTASAQVPAPLSVAAPAPTVTDVDLNAVFSAMADFKNGGRTEDAESALMALADIKTTGTGALPAAGVIPAAWVGKLWQGKRYVRKYIDLVTHTYGPIDIGGREGYRIDQGTALVAKRGQEKTELPTGSATTSKRATTRDSYGYAADVAQEWNYLTGGADLLQSFWQGVADSYAKVTDQDALATLMKVAGQGDSTTALSRLIAPASLPTPTPANVAYYPGVVQLIQAIEAISDADDDPAWAIVNPVLWSQLIYTPKDLLPEFVSLSVTAGTGEANVDGKVIVKKAPQSAFPGTNPANPQVAAGSKAAVEFKELGETPIQIDAVNVAKFGVDRSIVGFLETFVVRPESTVYIGTKP